MTDQPNRQLVSEWPAREQMLAIADTAMDLAEFIRKYEYLCVNGERVDRKFVSNPHGDIIIRLERLDYLLHGRMADDLDNDYAAWREQGWPFSLASRVVGSPGSCENPTLIEQLAKGPFNILIGEVVTGWAYPVLAPYRDIFAKFAAIKCFYDHMPIYEIETWTKCDRQALIEDITADGIVRINPAQFSPWFDSPHWRAVRYGTIENGTRRSGVKPTRLPHEVGSHERLVELQAKGVPVEWIDSLSRSAGELTSRLRTIDEVPTLAKATYPVQRDDKPEPASDAVHSTDFRSVRWFGSGYSFTANQAAVVKLLFENWKSRTPDVGDETLLLAVDPEAPPARLSTLFRDHPAWGAMIVAGGTKGTHRLAEPDDKNT